MEIGIKKHGVITMNRGRVKSRDAKNYQVEIYQGRQKKMDINTWVYWSMSSKKTRNEK